jgi:murein DD-endopeptidase MepM/ murein hydrolase activator NlpD
LIAELLFYGALVITPTFTDNFEIYFGTNAAQARAAWISAATIFENNFSDNFRVNITVDAVLGASYPQQASIRIYHLDYSHLRSLLVADSKSDDDACSLAPAGSVNISDPVTNPHLWWISRAQAKAIGYLPDDLSDDGTTTFFVGNPYCFAGPIASNSYDFRAVVAQSISQVMGRFGISGYSIFNLESYTVLDNLSYGAAHTKAMGLGAGNAFSIDDGATLLQKWNDSSITRADSRDWDASAGKDAFSHFYVTGAVNPVTEIDLKVMDVIGYDRIALPSAPTLVSPGIPSSPGLIVPTLSPTFEWGSVLGAAEYGLYLRDVTIGTLVYSNDDIGNNASQTLPAGTLAVGHAYSWNMRARNSAGFSTYSRRLFFVAPGGTGTLPLTFPLTNLTPYTVTINAVFDHSMTNPYDKSLVYVTDFRNEIGYRYSGDPDPGAPPNGFRNQTNPGQPFIANGNYAGEGAHVGYLNSYLSYAGHPGYDYRAKFGTALHAAAAGIAHFPASVPGLPGNPADWGVLQIDHLDGYKTYYLHLSAFAVSENQSVARGVFIGRSGHTAPPGSEMPDHFHFEVQYYETPVDPYGWLGTAADPYTLNHQAITNVNLWGMDPPPVISGPTGGASTGGQFQFAVDAPGEQQVTIQASTDLILWANVATLTVTNGYVLFVDPTGSSHRARFYRAAVP